jgi:putative membrane protein
MVIASSLTTQNEEHIMIAKKISIDTSNIMVVVFAALLAVAAIVAAPVARADNAPITDDGFVRDAFLSNQTEIEISQVVLAKSHNAKVKKLAKGMIKDYTQANTQLRTLAAGKNLAVPTLLDNSHKTQVEQFKNVDNEQLDASYRTQIQQHHDAAIALYDRVAKNPRSDAELRVFAFKMLPVLHKYQQAVAQLNTAPIAVASRKAL